MATSGSVTFESYPGQSCTTVFAWSEKSSNIANNTKTLSVTCKITHSPAGSNVYGTVQFSLSGGSGVTFSPAQASVNVDNNATKTYSTTAVITCSNVTGSAAGFSRLFTLVFTGYVNGKSVTQKISDTLTVNPNGITRRSSPTIPSSITLGTNFTVTTNRASSAFTHTIQLKLGSSSFTNLATGVGASKTDCNASIATWAPYVTTATSATGTIRTITYENNQQIGYVDNTLTVNVPTSCKPSVTTPVISDTNGYYSEYGYFLSGASRLHLSWSETISYGSAIKSRSVNLFGSAATISNVTSSGCDVTISNIGTNEGTATVTVKDARGRTGSATSASFKIYSYSKPVVGNSVVYRSDENGDSSLNGDHIAMRIPWSKSSLLDENDEEQNFVKIYAKIDNVLVATYGDDTTDAPNNQVIVLPGTYSDAVNYTVELTVQDTVGQSSNYITSISSISRPLSVRAYMDQQTGTKKWGMAIGKVSEIPEALEVDVPTYMYRNLTIERPDSAETIYRSTTMHTSLDSEVPSSTQRVGGEATVDVDGKVCFYSQVSKTNADNLYRSYIIRRYSADGSKTYNNGFYLYVRDNGTPEIAFPSTASTTKVDKAWRDALGLSNYNNTNFSTSTVADVITANSTNATISGVSYAQSGYVAMLQIAWTNKNDITIATNGVIADVQIGTLVSDKRPRLLCNAFGRESNGLTYSIAKSGLITLLSGNGGAAAKTIAAGTANNLYVCYLI